MKRLFLVFAIVAVLISPMTAQIQYTSVTCSNTPNFTVVFVTGINNSGTMVGTYFTDTDPTWHALKIKNGVCTPLAPNTALGTKASGAWSINEAGDIVGAYFDGPPLAPPYHGFLLTKAGVLKTIEFQPTNSFPQAINQSGTIAGSQDVLDSSGNILFTQGFVLTGSVFSNVMFPGSASTAVAGINARGDCVGYWNPILNGPEAHGFVHFRGEYVQIDVPFTGATTTLVEAINDKGYVAGAYSTPTIPRHGFVAIGKDFIDVAFPGAFMTNINGINNKGQIVGWYFTPTFELRGYVAEMKP